MLVPTNYLWGRAVTDDEYLAIGRQFGRFFRRAERFHQSINLDVAGRPLERAAYGLLGRIAGGGPARLSVLATDMSVDLSTVSRQVAALEAAGLVRRTPDPTDRRASLIEATETGADVFVHNRSKWLAALRELLGDWTSAERQEFARLFARLNEAMENGTTANRPARSDDQEIDDQEYDEASKATERT
jgi:DNA-binding MarR family transcriptional regulator